MRISANEGNVVASSVVRAALAQVAEIVASRDRLAAYVRAVNARLAAESCPINLDDLRASMEPRQAARVAEKQARAAVIEAGDISA